MWASRPGAGAMWLVALLVAGAALGQNLGTPEDQTRVAERARPTRLNKDQVEALTPFLPQEGARQGIVRSTWPPLATAKAAKLRTTTGDWSIDPPDTTKTASDDRPIHIFVVVDLTIQSVASAFRWDDPLTSMDPWSLRNVDVHFVFLPMTQGTDALQLQAQAKAALSTKDFTYWAPRMHFSVDTVASLRESNSWLAEWIDAYAVTQPTLAVFWGHEDHGHPSVQLLDATEAKDGLYLPSTTLKGACENTEINGLCGELAYYGLACESQPANSSPDALSARPFEDVRGKVAVVERGSCTFIEKIVQAKSEGALGVVFTSDDRPRGSWQGPEQPSTAVLPGVLIDREPGQVLKEHLTKSNESIKVVMFERASPPWGFALDGEHQLRPLMLWPSPALTNTSTTASTSGPSGSVVTTLPRPSLAQAILEAKSITYQQGLRDARKHLLADKATVLPVLNGTSDYDAVFSVPEDATRERLYVYLELRCAGRAEEACPVASQVVKLRLCPVAAAAGVDQDAAMVSCTTEFAEIGRLFSAAGREMTAMIEVTDFISLLPAPGRFARLSIQGPIGFRPYLELLLPPPENGVVGDSVTTAGTNAPSKVKRISLREENVVAVPADVSSVRLVGFATTDLEELSRMNPTPQMPEGGMMHVFSLSSGGKCEVPIRGLAGGKLPCYNESAYFGTVVPNQRGDEWYAGQYGQCAGSVVIPFACDILMFDPKTDGKLVSKNLTIIYQGQQTGNDGYQGTQGPDDQAMVTIHTDLSAFLVLTSAQPEAPMQLAMHPVGSTAAQRPEGPDALPTDFQITLSELEQPPPGGVTSVVISWIPPAAVAADSRSAPPPGDANGSGIPAMHYLVTITNKDAKKAMGQQQQTFLLPIPPTSSATTTLEIKNVIPQTPYTITVATVTPAGTSQSAVTSFVADAPVATTSPSRPGDVRSSPPAANERSAPAPPAPPKEQAAPRSPPMQEGPAPGSSAPHETRKPSGARVAVVMVGVAMAVGALATLVVLARRRAAARFFSLQDPDATGATSVVPGQHTSAPGGDMLGPEEMTKEEESTEVPKGGATAGETEEVDDLNVAFVNGQKLLGQLDELDSTSDEYAKTWGKALDTYKGLKKKVESLSLISSNEEIDDIATTDLKFILVDYYLADLLQKAPGTGRARLSNLERAKHQLTVFMQKCERITLLKGEDLKAWEEKTSVEEEDATPVRPDPAKARAEKIERFKKDKAAKERLRELTYLLDKLSQEGGDDQGEVEEVGRERVKLIIDTSIRKAIDDVVMINQELPILEMMATREPPKPEDERKPAPPPPQPTNGLSVTHVDSVNGQLRLRKEEVRARVFQPGYNLPTMTLEEYADLEVQAAKEREERSKNAPKPPRRYAQLEADGDEDNEALVEESAYRDRAWDNFKDDNPRGSGNKAGKLF